MAVQLPPAPRVTFASDNAAAVHPSVLGAIHEANTGHAVAYGHDSWTRRLGPLLSERFGTRVEALPVGPRGETPIATNARRENSSMPRA